MTSASHAEGRQFDPGQVYLLEMRRRWSTRASGQRSRVRSEAPDKRSRTCALSPRCSRIAASIMRLAGHMGPRGGWLTAALARLAAGAESSLEACFQSVPSSRTRDVSALRASAWAALRACVRAFALLGSACARARSRLGSAGSVQAPRQRDACAQAQASASAELRRPLRLGDRATLNVFLSGAVVVVGSLGDPPPR